MSSLDDATECARGLAAESVILNRRPGKTPLAIHVASWKRARLPLPLSANRTLRYVPDVPAKGPRLSLTRLASGPRSHADIRLRIGPGPSEGSRLERKFACPVAESSYARCVFSS
jgi:hypothetical protein